MSLKIMSIPGKSHENRYFQYVISELERRGVIVVPASFRNCLLLKFDILHVNFPTHYVTEYGIIQALISSIFVAAYLSLVRLVGCKIVYTVHDVVPLKIRNEVLLRYFLRFFLSITNGFIFLSRSSRAAFERTYPQQATKPWVTAPHGPYSATPISKKERAEARTAVTDADPAFIVGFLGAIKPYKNADALLELPAKTDDGRSINVVIAGKIERGYEAEVEAVIAGLPNRVTRVDRRLSDADLDRWIQIVDLVLLPYVKGSNSGSALLVLSNRARFAASGLAAFAELFKEVGRPWVYCLDAGSSDRQTYTHLINMAAGESPDEADQTVLSTYLEQVSWSSAALITENFYRDISAQQKLKRIRWKTT